MGDAEAGRRFPQALRLRDAGAEQPFQFLERDGVISHEPMITNQLPSVKEKLECGSAVVRLGVQGRHWEAEANVVFEVVLARAGAE